MINRCVYIYNIQNFDRPDLSFVCLGPSGEWLLAARNGRMWWDGLSEDCYEELRSIRNRITFTDFGSDGDYCLRYQ